MSALINQWGPWLFIACGVGWLFWPMIVCIESIRLNRRTRQSFARLPPAQQDLARHCVGPGPSPTEPFLRWLSGVAAAHFAVGIIWLACR